MVPLKDLGGFTLLINPAHVAVILDEKPMYAVRVVTVFGVEYAVQGTMDSVCRALGIAQRDASKEPKP